MVNLSKEETENKGIKIYGTTYNNLRYADDIDVIAESAEDLQAVTTAINKASARTGMEINLKKTKTMTIGRAHEDISININNTPVEQVRSFIYLGSNITENNKHMDDLQRRLGIARQKFNSLRTIWSSKRISNRLKLRALNALIFPIVHTVVKPGHLQNLCKTKLKLLRCNAYAP